MTNRTFQLPSKVNRYARIISERCQHDGQTTLSEILLNSSIQIKEHQDEDFEGREVGHAITLIVPDTIRIKHFHDIQKIQKDLLDLFNKANTTPNEYISNLYIDIDASSTSGVSDNSSLSVQNHIIKKNDITRIWGDNLFRIFLSHKSIVKRETSIVKNELSKYGISCFVAHEDIEPTKAWQDEIKNALFSMDMLVALMDDTFHESNWTDQEIGIAIGRGIPIISIKLGEIDPYGFIGKFQALKCSWVNIPKKLTKKIIKHTKMLDAYIYALEKCDSFECANTLAELLPEIDFLTEEQATKIVKAYTANSQLKNSFGFNGQRKQHHGMGLFEHLKRITGKDYSIKNKNIPF